MFKRGLIIGAFNPFHEGHGYLFSIAQKFTKSTDIYIGNRDRGHKLPHHIRAKIAEESIRKNDWQRKLQIINAKRHLDLNGNEYDLFITGSDMLNAIHSDNQNTRNRYRNYLFSFPNILSISRKQAPLAKESRAKLSEYTNLIELEAFSTNSSTKIRQAYQEGKDISPMVSETTWETIKDYVHIFKD